MGKEYVWNGEGVIGINKKDFFKGEVIPIEEIEKRTLRVLIDEKKIIPKPESKKGRK